MKADIITVAHGFKVPFILQEPVALEQVCGPEFLLRPMESGSQDGAALGFRVQQQQTPSLHCPLPSEHSGLILFLSHP